MRRIDPCINISDTDILTGHRQALVPACDLRVADQILDSRDRAALAVEQVESAVGVKRSDTRRRLENIKLCSVYRRQYDRQLREVTPAPYSQRSKHRQIRRCRLVVECNNDGRQADRQGIDLANQQCVD